MKKPFWPIPGEMTGMKLGLNRILNFLDKLGNPHLKLPPVIHIAGTNGKGSTLAFITSILEAQGYKVHRNTSPHLVRFNERINLAGKDISDEYLTELLNECKAIEDKYHTGVSYFEGITAAAILAFSRIPADAVLLEVGMGGRLDGSNVIPNPLVSVITPVSLDHTKILGDTPEKIAYEKAGIIKANCKVVSAQQTEGVNEVLKKQSDKLNADFVTYGKNYTIKVTDDGKGMIFEGFGKKLELPLPSLPGPHQVINAGTAIATLLSQDKFEISDEAITKGVQNAKWKARLEKIEDGRLRREIPKNFEIYIDGGHNEHGARMVAEWLKKKNQEDKKPTYAIFTAVRGKDVKGVLGHLSKVSEKVICTEIKNESRAAMSEDLYEVAKKIAPEKAIHMKDWKNAIEYIKNIENGGRVLFCGSLYFAGQILEYNEG